MIDDPDDLDTDEVLPDDEEHKPDEGPESAKADKDSPESEDQDPTVLSKRLKDTQKKFTQIAQEKAELARQFAMLTGRVDEISRSREKKTEEVSPFAYLDDEKTVGELLDDPKNVRDVLKRTLGVIADMVQTRDQALLGRMVQEIESRDPTIREVKAKIEELKQDPDYDGFSDRQLAVIAKKNVGVKREETVEEDEDDGFRGSAGSGRKPVRKSKRDPVEDEVDRLMAKMGYDEDHGFKK